MKIKTYPVGEYGANCYFVIDEENKDIVIVDPGANGSSIIREIESIGFDVKAILLTHCHFDHIGAVVELNSKYKIPVYLNQGEADNMEMDNTVYRKLPEIYKVINDGEILNIGSFNIKCIHTPGHSKGGMCFLINDAIFTGDTLFQGSIGRTDFISGDLETLINSIEEKLMVLDKNTIVYPGHGPSSTIIYERMRNPFLQ